MDNSISITQTKIFVPRRRSDLLSRQRLLDGLYELLDYRLILLVAQAGYGKTSLLIDFAHHTEWPFCWYTLDHLDREPQRFLTHLIASLSLQFPSFGKRSRTVLQNMSQGELNLDSMVSVMVNDAFENITEHFVLVLDDYHMVDENPAISYFVSRFVQDMDDNCHIIIASRMLVALPELPLMVARSQVGGLGFEELAFHPQEIQDLLQQNHHRTISDALARELAHTSEGWITGLLLSSQMAQTGIADRLRMGKGSNVGLYDFLADQVLRGQTPEVRTFLLRSSLLDEFDASFCQEVIGASLEIQENWEELISSISRQNLFVLPVGDDRIWMRYHRLFLDFLRARMLQERPAEAEHILTRLAEVYQKYGEWERTYELYSRLQSTDKIITLLENVGGDMISAGRLVMLAEWIETIPPALLQSNAVLLSLYGSVLAMRGEPRRGITLLDQAVASQPEGGEPVVWARILMRRATVNQMQGQYQLAAQDAENAFKICENHPELQAIRAAALHRKGISFYYLGWLKEAVEYLTLALEVHQSLNDEKSAASLWMDIGLAHTSIGNYLTAEDAYKRALEYWRRTGNATWLANLLNNLGDLQRQLGEYEAAINNLEQAVEYARVSGYLRMEAYSLATIGDLYRDLDALDQAQEAYSRARTIALRIQDRLLHFYLDLSEAALLHRRGKIFQAQSMLENTARQAEAGKSAYEKNMCSLERGRMQVIGKEYAESLDDLKQASAYFVKEGQSVEMMRAQLYLALATFGISREAGSYQEFVDTFSRIPGQEFPPALLVSVREVRPLLNEMRAIERLAPLVDYLCGEADRFEQMLAPIRRQLRRKASVIPFAPPHMHIQALGKVQVSVNDRPISTSDWQVQVARDLFFFLLARQEGITKEAVGEVFWLDSSPAELKLRFKNCIYRLRHAVGKEAIVFRDEIYQFNTGLDYEYDVELFFKEIYHAERTVDLRQKINFYQVAVKLYQGPYMPGVDDTWVLAERQKILTVYVQAVLKLGALYLEINEFDNALLCGQRVLTEDPCLEGAHRLVMQTYAATGNRAMVVRQYEYCRQILSEELNTTPSANTQTLYETLMH